VHVELFHKKHTLHVDQRQFANGTIRIVGDFFTQMLPTVDATVDQQGSWVILGFFANSALETQSVEIQVLQLHSLHK